MARIEVQGNAGSEAELKFIKSANGDFAVASFSLAETPREKKNGEWVDGETVWYKVSATGKNAELYVDFVQKGKTYLVIGTLKHFSYQAKDGTNKSGFEIRAESVTEVARKPKAKQAESSWGNEWN